MSASARLQVLVTAVLFLVGMTRTAWAVPETTVTFSVNDIDFSQTDGYDILNVAGCHLSGEPGQPLLPCKAVNFVIPRGQGVSHVRVDVEAKEHLPGTYYIYPAQPDMPGYGEEDFVGPDADIYDSDQPFPGTFVGDDRTSMAWGWKTYQVVVWPLEYLPADREIWLYETVKISLDLVPSTESEQEILARTKERQEEWAQELEQVMANPEDVSVLAPQVFSGLQGPRRWVLILPEAPQMSRDVWHNTFQLLINHRASQGWDVEVIHVDGITSQTGEAGVDDIRDYLRDQHENHNAQWACLVGDNEMIPWTYRNLMPDPPHIEFGFRIPNDWCYCDLDGEWIAGQPGMDWAPEIWAGRVPCISPTEGEYFVNKVLAYEENPGNGDYDYLDRAFYESADVMTDSATCEQVMMHQHSSVEATLFTEQPSGSDPDPTFPWAWQVVDEINSTKFNYVVVHCHGSRTNYATMSYGYSPAKDLFDLSEIDSLENEDYYYFWYSVACHNAHLDRTPSRTIAEGATCVYENRCAFAFAGNTREGYPVPSRNLNCHAWDQLFPGPFAPHYFNHAGAVEARSRQQGYRQADVANVILFSHNLFGDPATPIWTPDYTPGSQKPLAGEKQPGLPTFTLLQCLPMPIRASCSLKFRLTHRSVVAFSVYDLAGRRVWHDAEESLMPGEIIRPLDCSAIPPGSYLLQLRAGAESALTRIVVVR